MSRPYAMVIISEGFLWHLVCILFLDSSSSQVRVKDIRWLLLMLLLLVKSHTNVTHFLPSLLLRLCNFNRLEATRRKRRNNYWTYYWKQQDMKDEKKVGDVSEQMMDRYRVCAPDALYNIENVLEESRKNAMGWGRNILKVRGEYLTLNSGRKKRKNTSEKVVVECTENKMKSIQIDSRTTAKAMYKSHHIKLFFI